MKEEKLVAHIDIKLKKRQILRRYLDLPKFVDFLRTGELYLEQASHFDDHLEGTLPEKIRQSICELPDFLDSHGDPSIWEQKNKNRTCLSCWTLGSKDNMALWKIYGIGEVPGPIRVPVNLDQFLLKIVVAPEAGNWFFDLVVDVARRYNVLAPVHRSELPFLLNKAKVLHK